MRSILKRLENTYPDAHLELAFSTPFQLLMALILAAQCTDDKVNELTSSLLFAKYPSPQHLVDVATEELEKDIHPTGFYRQKARSLQRCGAALVERFGGEVPRRLDDLLSLPGIGRKSANILIGNAFGGQAIGVDTHTWRLAQRLGFTDHDDPDKIETDLTTVVPGPKQTHFCHLMQAHGRRTCVARKPRCPECVLLDLCPYDEKTVATMPAKAKHRSSPR